MVAGVIVGAGDVGAGDVGAGVVVGAGVTAMVVAGVVGPDGRAPDGGGFAGVGRLLSDVVPAAFTHASGAGTIADRVTVTLSITATVTVAVAEPDVFDDHGTGAHASPAVAGSFGGEPQAGDVHFGAGQRHAAEAVGEEP